MEKDIVNDLVDSIIMGNNSEAKEKFDSVLSIKLHDALENRKKEYSETIFNKETEND